MNRKRLLIIGPGYGHNVDSTLAGLSRCEEFDISFWGYSLDETFVKKYNYVHFLNPQIVIRKDRPLYLLRTLVKAIQFVWKSDFDVIYSLGMGGYLTAFLFLISGKKIKKAIEIYSMHIIGSAYLNKSFLNKCDHFVIDKADYICQYWWGVREVFVNTFPQYEKKFLMYSQSYPDYYFYEEKPAPISDFVKDFLDRIPDNQIVCFWPRSFIASNNHKLLLDSLGHINKSNPKLLNEFKLYLWGGNVEDKNSREIIEESIKRNKIESYVEIVDHPFVPRDDIFAIEGRSDFFVQIANDDILSSYIMEMIGSGKPFVLSNLRTFQFLNEKYGLNIDFVENNEFDIADRISRILEGLTEDEIIEFKNRRDKCAEIFSVSKVTRWYTTLYNRMK